MKKTHKTGRVVRFRLAKGSDLLGGITDFCAKNKIRCGTLQAVGATSRTVMGYYNQARRKYVQKTFRGEMEILALAGNVSIKDGKPFPHVHAMMSDTKLLAWGGHLFPGTIVFAAEVCVTELKGPARVRVPDPQTGLMLWGSKR